VKLDHLAAPSPSAAGLSRRNELLLLAVVAPFILLAFWLQRGFWLNSCPGQIGADCPGQWTDLLWTFAGETLLCVGLAVLLAQIRARALLPFVRSPGGSWARGLILFACAVALLAPLLVANFVLDRFPNSGDEYSYLFQAQAFADFRLWRAPPILGDALIPSRTFIFDGRWLSQYPPGWAFVLAAGSRLGLPFWAINAILGSASVAALATLCRRVATPRRAAIAAALYALTPFYVMSAASYFPHVFSALLILCLCLFLYGSEKDDDKPRLIAAGACLGALAATRYFDLVALAPAFLAWLFAAARATRLRKIALLLAGFLPFVSLLAVYQYIVLGSPFRSSYAIISSPDTFLSLDPLLLAVGPLVTGLRLAELALWTSPLLLIAYVVTFAAKARAGKLDFADLVFPGFVLAYVAFANFGGNRYGPRYYFDAYPLIFVTIVSARLSSPLLRALAPAAALTSVLYLLSAWPLTVTGFSQQIFARKEPCRLAAEAGLANAVLILDATSPGLILPDLVRNPPTMDAATLYARAGADSEALRKAFPTRSIWTYRRAAPGAPGEIARVAP
jgi:hypothetical protein